MAMNGKGTLLDASQLVALSEVASIGPTPQAYKKMNAALKSRRCRTKTKPSSPESAKKVEKKKSSPESSKKTKKNKEKT